MGELSIDDSACVDSHKRPVKIEPSTLVKDVSPDLYFVPLVFCQPKSASHGSPSR